MKFPPGRGRPMYRIRKLKMLRNRNAADRSEEPRWRASDTRAGLSLLDLELFTFEVQKRITWAEMASDHEPDEDEPWSSDRRRHRGHQQMRIEGDVDFRWRER